MDLFCWINSVADGNNSGAETALVPTEILLKFLSRTEERGFTSLEVSA